MRLAATLTMLSAASEYSAALPVIHQAAPFSARTMHPTPRLPRAKCLLVILYFIITGAPSTPPPRRQPFGDFATSHSLNWGTGLFRLRLPPWVGMRNPDLSPPIPPIPSSCRPGDRHAPPRHRRCRTQPDRIP